MKDFFDLAGGNSIITILFVTFVVVVSVITLSNLEEETDNLEVKEMISKTKNVPLLMLQWTIIILSIAGIVTLIIWIKNNFF